MTTDDFVQVPPDVPSGKKVGTTQVTVGGNVTERQVIVLADPADPAGYAVVTASEPVGTEHGLVVRTIPSAASQPVSVSSLPLPTGASTEAALAAVKTGTDRLDVLLSTRTKPSDTQLVDGSAHVQPISGTVTVVDSVPLSVSGNVAVINFPATQPVSATSLPLPTGAATEASLGTDGASPPLIPGTGIRGWLRSIYDRIFHGFLKSTLNFTITPLAASATYTGNWELITDYEQLTVILYGEPSTFQGVGTSAAGTLIMEFSTDGGTTSDVFLPVLVDDPGYFIPYSLIPVGTHYRLTYKNDGGVFAGGTGTPTTQTKFRLNTLLHKTATKELARSLSQSIRDNQPVILTRSVTMGKDPNGTYVNSRSSGISALSPTQTLLGAGGVYTSNVVDLTGFIGLSVLIQIDQNSAANGIDIQYSDTLAFTQIRAHTYRTVLAAEAAAGSKFFETVIKTPYLRVVYTNGATPQGAFSIIINALVASVLATDAVDGTITGTSFAAQTKSVTVAKNPDGTYINTRASGIITLNPTPTLLNAAQVYTSNVVDLTGFYGLSFLFQLAQVSASNGIDIQFSDTLAFTQICGHILRTASASDVATGSKFFECQIQAPFMRVVYTNGGVNQTVFSVITNALVVAVPSTDSVEGTINAASTVAASKSTIVLKDPSVARYDNITRSTTDGSNRTGQHVGIVKHEVATPILALTSWVTGQATIASTTVAVNVIPAQTSGRKTFAVKALSSNTKVVFVGPTVGVTSGSGWELAAGESVVVEVDTTAGVWVIGSTTTAQSLCYIEVVGT